MSAPSKITCNNGKGNKRTFNVSNAVAAPAAASTTVAPSAANATASSVSASAVASAPASAPASALPAAEKPATPVEKAKAAAATAIKAIDPYAKVIANIFSELPALNEAVTAFNIALAAYNKSSGLPEIKLLDATVTETNTTAVRNAAATILSNIRKVEANGKLSGGRRKTHHKKHGKRSKTHKKHGKHHKKHGKRSRKHRCM
jgi:hypothetical protein